MRQIYSGYGEDPLQPDIEDQVKFRKNGELPLKNVLIFD